MISTKRIWIGLAILFATLRAGAQQTQAPAPTPAASTAVPATQPAAGCVSQVRSTYLLGPEDELQITGPELEELANKTARVDGEGDIQVPLVGRVHVAGLTVQQAELELNKRLSTYIRHPQASIMGAVNSPGVHQVEGHKTLLEMLSMAGGTRADAGYSIRITRNIEWGCIPLPGATTDPSGRFSIAQVNLRQIEEAKAPEENIQIFPHDVISVPKAELIYVTGAVKKSGGFILGENQSMSVLQAVSLAEGLGSAPDAKHAKIVRMNGDQRQEIPVDLKSILQGKAADVAMHGKDILFVPDSTGKRVALRVMEAAIQTGTGLAIYHP